MTASEGNDHAALDARLLRAVLDGVSYAQAGRIEEMSAAAAERRVKRLARQLQTVVGVVGVHAHAWPGAALLRAHRADFLEALDRYRPDRVLTAPPATPSEADIGRLCKLVATHCRQPMRAQALLLLLFATGLRPGEVAGLRVDDYLRPDGTVRSESQLRADVAHDGRSRPLYFTSAPAVSALDRYLAARPDAVRGRLFRGLDPASALILVDGTDRAAALHGLLRGVFRYAWAPGLTARSARRYAAAQLHAQGVPDTSIAAALGLRQLRSVEALRAGHTASPAAAMRALLPSLDDHPILQAVVGDRAIE